MTAAKRPTVAAVNGTTPRPLPSTTAHLDAMVATGADGWLVISTVMAERRKKPWASWCFATHEVDATAQCAADLDAAGRNVYVRTNLIGEPLPADGPGWSWKRGGGADTGSAVALVVDLDVAGPGHHQSGAGLPLPPDLDTAMSIVAELPAPSMHITTGGGSHLWWLLDEPVTDDPVGLIETWADRVIEAGRVRGWHVDRPDPARVLRVCGTHRRKPGLAANLVTLTDVAGWPAAGLSVRPWVPTGRYGTSELLEALPEPAAPAPPPTPPARPRRPGEVGPANAVAQLPWSAILEPLGWVFVGQGRMGQDGPVTERWKRPGATSEHSIVCIPDGPAVAFSDACGLPTGGGQRLSKWRVYVALHHNGDEVGAGRTLRQRAREVSRRG